MRTKQSHTLGIEDVEACPESTPESDWEEEDFITPLHPPVLAAMGT